VDKLETDISMEFMTRWSAEIRRYEFGGYYWITLIYYQKGEYIVGGWTETEAFVRLFTMCDQQTGLW